MNLRTLRMADCSLREFVAKWILKSPFLATVRELDLSGNPLLTEDLVALGESEHVADLERLLLGRCGLDDAALHAIMDAPNLHNLKMLDLGKNPLSQRAIVAFSRWPKIADFTHFVLPWGRFTKKTRDAFLKSTYLSESMKDHVFQKTLPKEARQG